MTPTHLWQATVAALAGHSGLLMLTGLATTAAFLLVALLVAWKRGRVDRWVTALAWMASFGFSAEGMWVVATQKAQVPPVVAVGVFFVAEAFQLASMLQAARRYASDGHPGKHGRAVWIISVAAGTIVALAAHNMTEAVLRFLIPLGSALLWWNTLTDDGLTASPGRWRWTPARLLEWLGAIEPDVDRDLGEAVRARRVSAMVTARLGIEDAGWLRGWHRRRLRGLAKTADDAMVREVQQRVGRALTIVELTAPVTTAVTAPVSTEEHVAVTSSEHLTETSSQTSLSTSPRTASRTSVRTSSGSNGTAIKIARLRSRYPDLTQAQIAKKASVSLSTAQRYWQPFPPADEPKTKTNGHAVLDTTEGK